MNSSYFLFLTIGTVICTGLFAWRLQRNGLKKTTAAAALPLLVLLGVASAKLFYCLVKLPEQIDNYGLGALIRTSPAEFSFVGGCAGVVLAVLLAARLTKQKAGAVLDAFAPCGALLAAVIRGAEGLLDPMSLVGIGDVVMNEQHCFFPVAVYNEMLYAWFYAVFMLEAVLALIVAAAGFLLTWKRTYATGRVFLHTALFLALPQIFSERMLGQCPKWGFVRIEQLMCALIVFAVILYACIRRGMLKAYVPALLCLLCAAVLIWIEFTLDNKLLFGIELSTPACYCVMIATLCCMAGLSVFSYHRLNMEKK